MARRFMCVWIGVLCLVAAYQVVPNDADTEWQPGATAIFGGAFAQGGIWISFTAGGEA